MQNFDARYCGLSGSIPSEIGYLQKLTNLALGNNKLDGRLPDSFFALEDLTFLGLDDNLLSANIGQFSVFTKLQLAYLENNLFTGTMSEDLVTMWSNNMIELDLSGNSINSTIPSGIFAMPKLVVLDLNGNHLRGSIPALAIQETSLELLALYDNGLTGVIPDTLSRLSPTLRHLDLSKNMLTTPLPDTLGQLTGLTYLFLGQNDFSRQDFPRFVFSLTNLKELSMKKNGLTGTIPSEIRMLSSLTLLDLDMNELVGNIPNELGYLTKLEVILLNRNNLSGPIPSTFSRLHDLSKSLIMCSAQKLTRFISLPFVPTLQPTFSSTTTKSTARQM
jgi:Leucine-rich repeat (LRR) protein